MSLNFPMIRLLDHHETVTMTRPQTGWTERIRRAVRINPRKSEIGFISSTIIPHEKMIWFLPNDTDLKPTRGDRIFDAQGTEWIIVDPVPFDHFEMIRCRCVHETLTPGHNDYLNLYRTESLSGQTESGEKYLNRVESYIPAIRYTRVWKNTREESIPIKTMEEKIVFLVKTNLDFTETDLVRYHQNGELYEIISYEAPPSYSDWGTLTVKKYTENHGEIQMPTE